MCTLPLLMVWLVLVKCPSIKICALGATPMFANCSNINSNFTNSSGGDFEAIGCSYPSKETTVSLGLGAGITATAYIAFGKVAAGVSARLSVECPAVVTSKSLRITITGIAFGQDASFRFTGALPPSSSLQISNNTFFLTKRNTYTFQYPSSSNVYTTAILIGALGIALVLEEGSTMSATNNTVTCRWAVTGNHVIVAVNFIGASATLRSMSAIAMSGNSIANSNISGSAYVAYLYLYSSSSSCSLTFFNQSAITMSGNSIVDSSFSNNAYVAYLSLYSSSSSSSNSLTLYNQSAIAVSANTIANSSISNSATVASLYLYSSSSSLTLSNQSAIALSANNIANSSFRSGTTYVAYLSLSSSSISSSSLTLSNQSAIAVNGSSITNSSFSSAYVAYLSLSSSSSGGSSCSLTLYNQSAIAVSGNTITKSSFNSYAYVAYLSLSSSSSSSSSNSLTLYNQSAIAVSGNSIANSSFNSYAYVAYLYLPSSSSSSSSNSLTLYNQSAIAISGNSIANSSFNSLAYVAYFYLPSSSSCSLTLSNQSAIAVSGNSIVNSSFSNSAYVAYLYLSRVATVGKLSLYTSAIIICNNSASSVVVPTTLLHIEVASVYLTGSKIEVRCNAMVDVTMPTLLKITDNVTGLPSPDSPSSGSLIIEENVVSRGVSSPLAPAAIILDNLKRLSLVKMSLNEVTGIPALASIGSLHLANGSLIASDNKLSVFGTNTTLISVGGYDNAFISQKIVMDGNTIDATLNKYSHLLLKAEKWSGYDTLVHACDNYVAGTPVLDPRKYFEPKSYFKFDPCSQPTGSPSLSLTSSPSPSTKSSSISLSITGSQLASASTTSPSVSISIVSSMPASEQLSHSSAVAVAAEVPPILPVPVPPATTATLSVTSSSLGGVTAAVDAQVVAAVGLVSCADDESGNLRGLSVAALDNTCEGVLLGNTVALAAGAFLSAVAVAVVRLVQVRRYGRAPVGPPPTLVSACAVASAPQLLLTACAYFMNSYALCGLRVGGVGLVAFVFALVVAASFPLLTWLFGARRLMRVRYNWEPRALGHVGSFVFQSWALDPSIDSHKLFGSVFGSYRRLSCPWTLTAHMSFIAGLPMMLATSGSGTCGRLFAVSTALYFLFALTVVVARPRRTTLADVLQACMLLANGLVLADATAVMYDKSRSNEGLLMGRLGTTITVLTVLRLVHSASGVALAFLTQRGVIHGVDVIDNTEKSGPGGLTVALPDAKHSRRQHHASRNSTWSVVRMPIIIFEGDGLMWKLPPSELAAVTYAIPLMEAFPAPTREEVVLEAEAPSTEEHPLPSKKAPSNKSIRPAAAWDWDSMPSEVPQFLTEDEKHRRELARDYGRRQIEELLLL